MNNLIFLCGLGIMLAVFMFWGFRHLPHERWQMLAVVPQRKDGSNSWLGTNLTYYGFFIATGQLLAIFLVLALLASMHISILGTLLAITILLVLCMPSSRFIARLVEKKSHTFTIGGSSFVGIIFAPFAIVISEGLVCNFTDCSLPLIPVMAALAIGYTLGEGLGRLACLSYGCCYGKPLKDCSPFVQRLFSRTGHIFYGDNKKASYESQLGGERLIPIQAITCIIYTLSALYGSWLFLGGKFNAALLYCVVVTQLWRFFSENLRADYRGGRIISAYQIMGICAVGYIVGLSFLIFPPEAAQASILDGLRSLWNPLMILGLQVLWLIFFVYFGRSTVTSATVSFTLHADRI